jgi:DNA polymerase V
MDFMMIFAADITTKLLRPLFASRVPAGFPSPAEDFVEGSLDLNKHLIDHPAATFFLRVSGDSMIGVGIHADDLLIVDRSLKAKNDDIVIAILHGELTVKRLVQENGKWFLRAENRYYVANAPKQN